MAMVQTPRALYRYLLRRIAVLPPDANAFYRHRIRQVEYGYSCHVRVARYTHTHTHTHTHTQEFKSHADDTEHERATQIIQKAIQDIEWIVKKVSFSPKTIINFAVVLAVPETKGNLNLKEHDFNQQVCCEVLGDEFI